MNKEFKSVNPCVVGISAKGGGVWFIPDLSIHNG